MLIQQLFQLGVAKGVWVVFDDDPFPLLGCDCGNEIHTIRTTVEDRRVSISLFMTNVHEQFAFSASGFDDSDGIRQGSV